MDDTRARDLCRSTCKHRTCTGRGDTTRWAHRCQLVPVPPELVTVHTSHQPQPPTRTSPGLSPHAYGPHDPDTAPGMLTVLGAGKWPQPFVVPVPDVLQLQRAAINRRAAS